MLSRGSGVSAESALPAARGALESPGHRAAALLEDAKGHERDGGVDEAIHCYREAGRIANAAGEHRTEAEALRRLAVVHHHRNEATTARELVLGRSLDLAQEIGDRLLACELPMCWPASPLRAAQWTRREPATSRRSISAEPTRRSGAASNRISASWPTSGGITSEALMHYRRSLEAFEGVR